MAAYTINPSTKETDAFDKGQQSLHRSGQLGIHREGELIPHKSYKQQETLINKDIQMEF